MFEINSNFIGNFKVGDNINHNCSTLRVLYEKLNEASQNDKIFLYKPIIIFNTSIIEAMLYDFHFRAKKFTKEGIQNVTDDILEYIRGKHIDELEKYIPSAKKHDLFDEQDSDFYEALDDLRKLRNRIHIQNTKRYSDSDESKAFSKEKVEQSELILEKVAKTLSTKYARRDSFHHVDNFIFPWNEHL
jgi:hypothetical protein